MRGYVVFLGLMVLALPGTAQILYTINMGFNISFSALSNSPAPSDSMIGVALYSQLKPWSPNYYQPPTTYYTNDLDIYVQWMTPAAPAEAAWILEKEIDGSFTRVAEVTNLPPVAAYANGFGESLTLTTNQVHSLVAGNWYVEVDFDGSSYLGNLVPDYARAYGPAPAVTIPPDDQNVIWSNIVISPDNVTAKVIFDASNSIDPFYLPMQYNWTIYTNGFFDPSAVIFTNTGVRVTNVLDVGLYSIGLQVNDSIANGLPYEFIVQVITPGQAVDTFLGDLRTAVIPDNKKRLLVGILSRAETLFNQGRMDQGCNVLETYLRLVKSLHLDDTLTSNLSRPVQDILNAFVAQ